MQSSVIGFMGLLWNTNDDTFAFPEISLRSTGALTKRELLSEIAKLFDLMGLQPVIIPAKILMQDIWKTTADWNYKITPDHEQRWNLIRQKFQKAQLIRLPRQMISTKHILFIHNISSRSRKVKSGAHKNDQHPASGTKSCPFDGPCDGKSGEFLTRN